MKAITLLQPWASLIAWGIKTLETRSWKTSYRGPLAIHAGLGHSGFDSVTADSAIYQVLLHKNVSFGELPFGKIIATCTLKDIFRTEQISNEKQLPFGDFGPKRYAWLLTNIHELQEPVGAKGALSIWEWNQ